RDLHHYQLLADAASPVPGAPATGPRAGAWAEHIGVRRAREPIAGARRCASSAWSDLTSSFGCSGLSYDRHLDLARVGQLFLDLLGDVSGQHLRFDVIDHIRAHHDPDLAAGLHREHLVDTLAGTG